MRFAALTLICAIGCADATEVRVRLNADDEIAARAVELRVTVTGVDEEVTERNVRIGEEGSFPFEVPIVPRNEDATRTFELVAELRDAAGETLGTQRILTAFAEGEQRIIERTFSASCSGVRCAAGRSCDSAECVSACVLVEGAGVPVGCRGNVCEERGLVAEDFEGETMWPACPDFDTDAVGTCLRTQADATARVVDASTSAEVLVAPPCGARVLRVETTGNGTDNAYIALPVEAGVRWARAMLYAPQSSFDSLEASSSRNQALMRWTPGRDVAGGQTSVNLRWNSGSTFVQWTAPPPAVPSGSGPLPLFPSDMWVCVEFQFDPVAEHVQVGIDGTLNEPNTSTIAQVFDSDVLYAHVGLGSGPDLATTLFIDDIVVSDERIPCP